MKRINPSRIKASGPDHVTGIESDNLVEVVYEVTVKVGEDDLIPEEHIMAQAIVDRFPELMEIQVQRA